jgi:hypothetical protein
LDYVIASRHELQELPCMLSGDQALLHAQRTPVLVRAEIPLGEMLILRI